LAINILIVNKLTVLNSDYEIQLLNLTY